MNTDSNPSIDTEHRRWTGSLPHQGCPDAHGIGRRLGRCRVPSTRTGAISAGVDLSADRNARQRVMVRTDYRSGVCVHPCSSVARKTPLPLRRLTQGLSLFLALAASVGSTAFAADSSLPADGIFPRGRKLAFMGYSGVPERDLANGFTVAGPAYGDQLPYLHRCFSSGFPVVAHIGVRLKFTDPKSAAQIPSGSELRQQIQAQVRALAGHKEIIWWAITPEELRPWKSDEMDYLKTVAQAIRDTDPQQRPIYLYNPNHRDAQSLTQIARQVDIVGKGCYVNTTGHAQERAWVQWSVEQEIETIHAAGRPGAIPLLLLELCKDPAPGEENQIRTWVRHDVYLGLIGGAKGVLIWSLYPRKEVQRTWQLWYDAYAECGRELNGERGLAQVLLFGQRRANLKVRQLSGETSVTVMLGGKVEAGTTSDKERSIRGSRLGAWTSAEFAYGDSRWLFLVNSSNTPSRFAVSGWPSGIKAQNAFSGSAIALPDSELPLELPANGVFAIRFSGGR